MEERKTATFENRKRRRLSAPSSAPLDSLHTYRNTLILRTS